MNTRMRDARLRTISSKVVFPKRFFSKPPAVPSLVVRRLTIIAALLMIICVLTVVATVHAVRVSGENKKPTDHGGLTPAATSQGPRQSSPVALAPNNQTLVNVNPESNTVTVFSVASDTPSKLAEIAVGGDPSSVAIHPDGNLAYVANSFDGTISIVNLNSLSAGTPFGAGAEPMAVALSPNGTRLYVANSASNTLGVYNTAGNPPMLVATIDLSSFGTAPRAIGITNDGDGDDTDETIFVALFFGELRPGKGAVDEGQDDQREGRLVAISAATNTVLGAPNPIVLGPQAVTGFNSNGKLAPAVGLTPAVPSTNPQTFTTPTGAFPNQLAAIALQPNQSRAYVVSTGASPNGPLRFNHMAQGLVSVFNTATRAEITSSQTGAPVRQTAPLNINQGVNLATTPSPRLFLTNPVAMIWRPDGSDAWAVIQNSDLIVRLTVDANGIPTVAAPLVAGPSQIVRVDLVNPPAGNIPGKAPQGLAINSAGSRAYVHNFVSRSVSVVDISNPTAPAIVGTALATPLPAPATLEETALLGAELFYSGRGPQERMSSESWGGCIVCHPKGRSDNVTWMFDAGPRQTIPLDGMFDKSNPNDQRILNWSAVRDENHDFELNTRGVFGGRGLIDDDRLFLAIGGASGATPTDSALIEQFQNFTGAITQTNDLSGGAPLPTLLGDRRDFGVATLGDDRVFIIGGRSGAGQGSLVSGSNTVLEFNPRTNALTPRNSAGFTSRHSLGAAAVKTSGGPRIYAVGGYASTSSTASPVGTVEEYNPATDTWRTVATIPTAVAQFGITVAGGVNTAEPLQLIHTFSGNKGSEASPSLLDNSTFTVQRFQADPTGAGVWSTFNPTGLTPRRNHGIATAQRGVASRIFIIGGQDAAGSVLSTVEEYQAQAVTAVLTPHTNLPAPRARFGIGSTLSSNQIYVIGGVDNTGADQTSVLEYTIAANPASPGTPGPPGTPSGVWVTRGNLSAARRGLQVTTPPGVTNFLPFRNTGRDALQDAIAVWIARKVRAARAPVSPTDPGAVSGQQLFNQVGLVIPGFSCATCHGGPKFTRSTVDYNAPPSPDIGLGLGNEQVIGAELRRTATQPNTQSNPPPPQFPGVLLNVGTFAPNAPGGRVNEIRFNGADISQAIAPLGANGFNIPSLLSVHETAPYFYSGLAQTLQEVLNGSQDANSGVRHHFVTSAVNRADLIKYLNSIESPTQDCTTTVTDDQELPGGLSSFTVTSGPNSVTVDHANAGTGLQSLTVVSSTNVMVNIPSFTPGTFDPVTVTYTVVNPNQGTVFTLRAASTFHAILIRVECGPPVPQDCTTTVTDDPDLPGGETSFTVTSGPNSVTVDHVNGGTGLQSLTVVGTPTNATVTIPPFTPGTFDPVTVTYTVNNPNQAAGFTLRARSSFHGILIRVECGPPAPAATPMSRPKSRRIAMSDGVTQGALAAYRLDFSGALLSTPREFNLEALSPWFSWRRRDMSWLRQPSEPVPEKGLSVAPRDEWPGASAYLAKVLFGPWQKEFTTDAGESRGSQPGSPAGLE